MNLKDLLYHAYLMQNIVHNIVKQYMCILLLKTVKKNEKAKHTHIDALHGNRRW